LIGSTRFLVTGALGCIGAWTCRRLVREGVPVVGFDLGRDAQRLSQIMTTDELARLPLIQGDITDLAQVESVIDTHQISHVIHLAAMQIPMCRADPALGARVNVVGTVNVFEAARRRLGQISSIAYTSSIGIYGLGDVDKETGRLSAAASAHPTSHYGVYKQANEGTARVFWEESGLPSVGLRPLTVFGVGRDQGLTSGPTKAIAAAVLGLRYSVPFNGPTLYQYADDVAAALIAAAAGTPAGAPVYNLPGDVVDGERLLATIESVVPEAVGLIRCEEAHLPLPWLIDTDGIESLAIPPRTRFEDGVRATASIYRDLLARNQLQPGRHGLTPD